MTRSVEHSALLALLMLYTALCLRHSWLVDDAFISFRYAHNLATGYGLRYNPNTIAAVEGYSNFAWVMLAALSTRLGLFPGTTSLCVSWLCGVGVLLTIYLLARRVFGIAALVSLFAVLGLAVSAPFLTWSSSGLEVMPQTLCFVVLASISAFGEGSRVRVVAVLVAVALVLLRVEGLLWVAGAIGVGAALRRWEGRESGSLVWMPMLAAVGAALGYELFRIAWFRALMANTVHAKNVPIAVALQRGALYLALYHAVFLVPLLMWPAMIDTVRSRGARGLWLVILALAAPGWAFLVGGDWMPQFRWLVPSLPFTALLSAIALGRVEAKFGRYVVLLLGALFALGLYLPIYDLTLLPARALSRLDSHAGNMGPTIYSQGTFRPTSPGQIQERLWMARALSAFARPGESVVAGAIGMIGYYNPTLQILDQCRIVNRWKPKEADGLRRAGHDQCTGVSDFYPLSPDILYFTTVCGAPYATRCELDPAAAIETTIDRALRHDPYERYYPAFIAISVPESPSGVVYGVGLRKGTGEVSREEGFARYRDALASLRAARPR